MRFSRICKKPGCDESFVPSSKFSYVCEKCKEKSRLKRVHKIPPREAEIIERIKKQKNKKEEPLLN